MKVPSFSRIRGKFYGFEGQKSEKASNTKNKFTDKNLLCELIHTYLRDPKMNSPKEKESL